MSKRLIGCWTECDGKGALSTNHFSTHILSASKALPSLPTPPKYTQGIPSFLPAIPASNPDFFLAPGLVHPHLQGMMTQLERLVGKEEFEKRMELVGKQVAIHAPAVVQASSVGGARTPPNTPRSGSPLRGDSKESNVKYGLHDRQHSSISVHSDATGRLSLAFDWEKPRKPSGSSSSLSPLSLTHTPETPESNDNKFMLVVQHDSKLDVQSMSQKGACPKCKGEVICGALLLVILILNCGN